MPATADRPACVAAPAEAGRPPGALGAVVLGRYRWAPLRTRLFLRARWHCTPYEALAGRLPGRGLILDLGAGHGLFALALALQAPGRRVLAVDHDGRRVALAGQAAAAVPAVRVRAGRLQEALAEARPAGSVAGIVLLDTLHYLAAAEQEDALARAHRALGCRGVLLVREVDAGPGLAALVNRLHERLMTGLGITRAGRLAFRTAAAWEDLLRRQGFAVHAEPCPSLFSADRLFLCRKR
jgi:SAM-dependent methyltransferase